MVTGVSDINTDPGFDRTIGPDMGPGGNMGLNVPMVSDGSQATQIVMPLWQHGPQTSTWSHMVAQTVEICIAFSGSLGHGN